jgi:hypothetical protein
MVSGQEEEHGSPSNLDSLIDKLRSQALKDSRNIFFKIQN